MKANELIERIKSFTVTNGDTFVTIKTNEGVTVKNVNNVYRDLYGNIVIE